MLMDVVGEGTFDPADFAEELVVASDNLDVGTTLLLQTDRLRVWEVRLAPGERGPFHAHTRPYFWTCVDAGLGRQRTPDGKVKVRRYAVGETRFPDHNPSTPLLHDLENAGESVLRFVTVELLDDPGPVAGTERRAQ